MAEARTIATTKARIFRLVAVAIRAVLACQTTTGAIWGGCSQFFAALAGQTARSNSPLADVPDFTTPARTSWRWEARPATASEGL